VPATLDAGSDTRTRPINNVRNDGGDGATVLEKPVEVKAQKCLARRPPWSL